jgi:glycerophosphoryl diester phosphodiesterase
MIARAWLKLALIAVLSSSLPSGKAGDKSRTGGEIVTREKPIIVAHRGASHAAPENTLPAFRLGFDEGADCIEGDFWLTRDEQVVSIHDADTARVAPKQPLRRVQESTLDELRELDVGAWKNAKYAGTRMPTLEEVLAIVPADKGIYIEIKDDRVEIVRHVKRAIDKSGLKPEQITVIAFDPAIIRAAKTEMPRIKSHWLYWWYWDEKRAKRSNTADEILHVARDLKADGIDINRSPWVNAEFVSQVRRAGLELHIYTVDALADAARYASLGIDSITTNRPQGLRKELDDYFKPTVVNGDAEERLIVNPDGTWKYRHARPRKK